MCIRDRIKTPAKTMARTDDNPVLKLAQCMLMKLKPLFDWSSATSLDSFETEVVSVAEQKRGHVVEVEVAGTWRSEELFSTAVFTAD